MAAFVRTLLSLVLAFAAFSSAHARPAPDSFADLAERLLPSVVNISTTQTIEHDESFQSFDFQFPEGSPFEDFFRDFKERHDRNFRGENEGGHKQKVNSLGSGFIIDSTGYIVTNQHVIQDAEEIAVTLQDETTLPAKVIGRDKKTDLAVLKVDGKKPLPTIAFGDSDKVRVGDWILAIGNPFGLGGTVTAGIISARARDINSGPYDDYLQTDAPINRGNSGGPMFNMDGEVIGINTAIFSPSGGSIGIGFAIPSTMARNVIDQLKTTGETRRGWIGVRIQTVTPEIAESIGLGTPRGALVAGVTADGPAAKAKVEIGDVIVAFDGKPIADMHRLPRLVADTEIGKNVGMTVLRKGKEINIAIAVAKLESPEEEAKPPLSDKGDGAKTPSSEKIDELGISVAPLTDALRKRYKIDKKTEGVVVLSAPINSLAAEHGIQAGDTIGEASQKEVRTGKDLSSIVKKAKEEGKPVLLLIEREGDLRFVAIKFEKK